MKKIEILAPAGSYESVIAAVRAGADAVYLGTKQLNARRNAGNFDFNELKTAVEYCHSHNTRVHLTLNTIVSDSEIPQALDIVRYACEIGIDAIIVQDLGLARLIHDCAPDMPLHASTQMSVQTLSGLKKLAEAGFTRAVLPRELSKAEIEYLCKNSPIELECFVHGALCMCVSGQCYFSAMLGSRSGNRGACAQPCRLPFGAPGSTGHDLSLKDLSLIDYIDEMADMGVCSFKIEGRMKRPEYVAAAVKACRNAVSGKIDNELKGDLRSVFSRSGFTDGYYQGKLGYDMFGTRQKDDVTAASGVLKKLEKIYEKEIADTKIDFAFTAIKNEPVSLAAQADGKNVFVEASEPQEAINKATTAEAVRSQLIKLGGTKFFVGEADIEIDDGLFIPVSEINRLRRDAIEQLEQQRNDNSKKFTDEFTKVKAHGSGKKRIICRFSNVENIPENWDYIEQVIVPLGDEQKVKRSNRVCVEVPRGIFSNDSIILEKLKKAGEYGISEAWAGTLDGIALAQEAGLRANAFFGTNIYNSYAVQTLEKMNVGKVLLSPELTLAQAQSLGGDLTRGVFAYGRIPLMLTRNCPQKNGKTCAECKRTGRLIDRRGVEFPIDCYSGTSEILNSVPVYMADRLSEIRNMDFMLLFFTNETKEETEKIIHDYISSGKPHGEFTRGLLYRGVE
ncbi:MAG: U32 family peptidase [Ruminococcus sp.]|nr:U32 family peptidase [Candidatus Copronaster equi]